MASAERVARGRSGWAASTSQGSGSGSAWRPISSERMRLHPAGRGNGSIGHAACELLAPLPPAVTAWLYSCLLLRGRLAVSKQQRAARWFVPALGSKGPCPLPGRPSLPDASASPCAHCFGCRGHSSQSLSFLSQRSASRSLLREAPSAGRPEGGGG
jgi:hypothetical protein